MNFTESFDQFSSRLGPTDLALYAGIGVVVWILFKDKLSPVQKLVADLFGKFKSSTATTVVKSSIVSPKEDVFFQLVASWKQTRDLAVKSNCEEAVRVADEMFPYLSPTACQEKKL